jgi:uncharacterized Zn-binding protein involved in type VI secretion
MAKRVQLRRGTDTEHNTFTGANGEVTVDTTNKTLRVHDGSTVGGIRLATLTGGLVPVAQLPAATTSTQGAVILNDTLDSTSAVQALTAGQGKVLNDKMFGVGQTVQDVTASRVLSTTYTNSTGKPILISITVAGVNNSSLTTLTVDGVAAARVGNSSQYGQDKNIVYVIPPSSTYSVVGSPINLWTELR